MTQSIEIHSEAFHVETYRRNYKRCRSCHERTGTIILSSAPIPLESAINARAKSIGCSPQYPEQVRLLVVCEKCGRRWIPSTGLGLRAMGR